LDVPPRFAESQDFELEMVPRTREHEVMIELHWSADERTRNPLERQAGLVETRGALVPEKF
jgi:hypothetical protein